MMQFRERHAAQSCGLNRLCIDLVLALRSEPHEIPGISKAHDLAPAIHQDLVEGNGTGLNAEHVGRWIALGEYKGLCVDAAQGCLCEGPLESSPGSDNGGRLQGKMRQRLHWWGSQRVHSPQSSTPQSQLFAVSDKNCNAL